jgi:hypothetical protein
MNHYDHLPVDKKLIGDFFSLSRSEREVLREEIRRLSIDRGLTYQMRAGLTEEMNLVPVPAVMPLSQVGYIARLCWEIIKIVKQIVPLYLNTPSIREILPLLPWEQKWLKECWRPNHRLRQPIIYRLDADVPLAAREAARSVIFFESNSVAVGGMFYAPVAESIIADATLRTLYGKTDPLSLTRNYDTRLIVLKKLTSHARSIGRQGLSIAVMEDKSWDTGITEFPSFVKFLRKRGVRAYSVDPRELKLRRKELCYRGKIIDIVYRNFELQDLIKLEEEGADMSIVKEAFKRNQVVSSLSGEFDHKSLWEILISERFKRLFTVSQRRFLSRHIPWTRLIYERTTTDPRGRGVDLIRFVCNHRTHLVIKPNRHCSGTGVVIGPDSTQREWEKLIEKTLRESRQWVVQKFVNNKMKHLPYRHGKRGFRLVPMYTTYGFISTPQGFGMIGRACKRRIVNVGRGGAFLSVFRTAKR